MEFNTPFGNRNDRNSVVNVFSLAVKSEKFIKVKMAFGDVEKKEAKVSKNKEDITDNYAGTIVEKAPNSENADTSMEELPNSNYAGTSLRKPTNPDEPEATKNNLIEKETPKSISTENREALEDPRISYFLNFLRFFFLPIKPFYESLKSSNPVFNKVCQLFEEKVTNVLTFAVTVNAWDEFKTIFDVMKRKLVNYFGDMDLVLETARSYYHEAYVNASEALDYIDRIYLSIVPAVPNLVPYFDSANRNLSIRRRCLNMFLNMMVRLLVHSLTLMKRILRFIESRYSGGKN